MVATKGKKLDIFHLLSEQTAKSLVQFCYSSVEWRSRIYNYDDASLIKNGNLLIPHAAVKLACYPVLFESSTNTHVRGNRISGENRYYSKESLLHIINLFPLRHLPHSVSGINQWLRSIIVGYDLSQVHRRYKLDGTILPDRDRRNLISQFGDWFGIAEWPREVDPKELLLLINADLLMGFY